MAAAASAAAIVDAKTRRSQTPRNKQNRTELDQQKEMLQIYKMLPV